ncbi:hypothetical protein BKA93DRAFT_741100 [Sparassis latifolia]
MSLPTTTDILIVGAGPVGLACALSLWKQGCTNFTVVDSVVHGHDSSRAIAVHAATLEALDSLGCAEPLIEAGRKAKSIGFWVGGTFLEPAGFDLLAPYTRYPFVLIVAQLVTERILGEKLRECGIHVNRPCKVVSLQRNTDDSCITDVSFEDGQIMKARCVVGADGARSIVRSSANVNFLEPGENSDKPEPQAVLADVTFSTPIRVPDSGVIVLVSPDNAFILSALPEKTYETASAQVYRIGATNMPPNVAVPPSTESIPYLQSLVDAWGPGHTLPVSMDPNIISPVISEVFWSSSFRTRSAIADSFFCRLHPPTNQPSASSGGKGGIILLVGDAAHIHSPVGGQGMNLGLCDAIALGSVLAASVGTAGSGDIDDAPLNTWALSRHARALTIINLSERLFGLMSIPERTTWVLGLIPVNFGKIRNVLVRLLSRSNWVRMMGAWRLSGLASKL